MTEDSDPSADDNPPSAAGPRGDDEPNDDGITRRRMLLGGGASVATVGGARALYNTVLGYGEFGMGTNLKEQDVAAVAEERLRPNYDESLDGVRVRADESGIAVRDERVAFGPGGRADATGLDSKFDLGNRLARLFEDLSALRDGEYAFEFHDPTAFFERLDEGVSRPEIVTAIRSNRDRSVDPTDVERFSRADPSEIRAVVDGLVAGFRDHTNYDVPRYLAGSVEDNVIFGAADLRQHFEDDVGFEALLESDGTGIFCWELVYRSIEALQAVRADRQSVPVAACYVTDGRHKHAYTGVMSAMRVEGELRLPMTFLDYTHSTLYDDVKLTGVLGEGLSAYDDGHRTTGIYW